MSADDPVASLHDGQLAEEIQLLANLMIAASSSPTRLDQVVIDGLLAASEPSNSPEPDAEAASVEPTGASSPDAT